MKYDEQLNRWAQRLENCIQAHDWYKELEELRNEIRADCEERFANSRKTEEAVWRELNTASLQNPQQREGVEDGLALEVAERLLTLSGYDKED